MKRKIIILLILMCSNLLLSQSKIYLNENLKPIDSVLYRTKCVSNFFSCTSFKKDSIMYGVVSFKYKMGRLTKEAYSQVLKVIQLQTKQNVNKSKSILIRFADTLFDYQSIKNKHDLHHEKYHMNVNFSINGEIIDFKNLSYNKTKYNKLLKIRNKRIKKCVKSYYKRQQSNFFYFYNTSVGNSKQFESTYWMKDKGLLRKFFFKKTNTFKFLILKPNGDYFLSDRSVTDKIIRKLLKKEDWKKYRDDLIKTYEFKDKNRIGLFKIRKPFFVSHCVNLNVVYKK